MIDPVKTTPLTRKQ